MYHPGATAKLARDASNDKRDIDVIKEHHRYKHFLLRKCSLKECFDSSPYTSKKTTIKRFLLNFNLLFFLYPYFVRFLWDEKDEDDSWEVQLARRYYDKLFKEYCIIDLSR